MSQAALVGTALSIYSASRYGALCNYLWEYHQGDTEQHEEEEELLHCLLTVVEDHVSCDVARLALLGVATLPGVGGAEEHADKCADEVDVAVGATALGVHGVDSVSGQTEAERGDGTLGVHGVDHAGLAAARAPRHEPLWLLERVERIS